MTAENGCKVKAKTVEANVAVQVTQAVENQRLDARVIGVDGVTAAGIVNVPARVACLGAIVGEVVDATKT